MMEFLLLGQNGKWTSEVTSSNLLKAKQPLGSSYIIGWGFFSIKDNAEAGRVEKPV